MDRVDVLNDSCFLCVADGWDGCDCGMENMDRYHELAFKAAFLIHP